jgi:hypothetical protein
MKRLEDYIGDPRTVNKFVLYIPKRIYDNQAKQTGLNTQRVIFRSPFSGPSGFWVGVEKEHADKMGWDKNRIFPISYLPAEIVLKWRVLKILK